MVTKTKVNQIDGEQPSLIILAVDYDTKLIMPIVEGLEFIRMWSTSVELKEPYNKAPQFKRVDKEFKMKFISEKQLKEMKVAAMLEPKEEP